MPRQAAEGSSALLCGLFIMLQSVLYGFGNPLSKIAYESISALWCLAARFALASAVFMALFGRRIIREVRAVRPADYLPAGICMALAYTSCNLALERTSATNVGFLMSLSVVFAPLLEAVLNGRRLRPVQLPLLAAVVGGLYLLCCNGSAFSFGPGEAWALITAVSVAGGLVFGGRAMRQLSAVSVSAVQSGVTVLLNLVLALLLDDAAALSRVQPVAWGVVAYLALGCTCIAYTLQNLALRGISPSAVSLLQCTQPILTALISFWLLGERLTPMGIAGAALILLCIAAQNVLPALRED